MSNIQHRSTSCGVSGQGRGNIPPTSLKSDRRAKSAAPGSKTAPGGSKTLPRASFRPSPASARSPAGPKIRPQTSPGSHRRRFSRPPRPFSASRRAPANRPKGKCNIPPISLKSDRAAKSAAAGSKTAPAGSKTLPATSLRASPASPRSRAGPKIRPQTSPASHRS